jgi:hypothetical protein
MKSVDDREIHHVPIVDFVDTGRLCCKCGRSATGGKKPPQMTVFGMRDDASRVIFAERNVLR